MKKLKVLFLGAIALTLVTGCGDKEQTLVCSGSQSEDGFTMEQEISMTFKNDKITYVKMDIDNKITDDDVKENWSIFTSIMDSQYEEKNSDGVIVKKENDEENYSYRITLEFDLTKASEEDLEEYGMSDITGSSDSLEDVKKSAEDDGFTCKVK